MREILFKAKRLDNGAWVEGYSTFDKGGSVSAIYCGPVEVWHRIVFCNILINSLRKKNGLVGNVRTKMYPVSYTHLLRRWLCLKKVQS